MKGIKGLKITKAATTLLVAGTISLSLSSCNGYVDMKSFTANELLNNGPYSISSNSIESINNLINFGIKTGFFGIEYAYQYLQYDDSIPNELKLKRLELVNDILNNLYDESKKIIKDEAEKINVLVPYLVKQKTLTTDQIRQYLDAVK